MHSNTERVTDEASAPRQIALTAQLQAVAEALAQIRYGVIQLTVHDGRVMQLDITERRRFT